MYMYSKKQEGKCKRAVAYRVLDGRKNRYLMHNCTFYCYNRVLCLSYYVTILFVSKMVKKLEQKCQFYSIVYVCSLSLMFLWG
jgi:hypothetical protein